MKHALPLLSLIVVSSLTTGCGKYEEGPEFSLRSKKERIANTWRIESASDGGNDVTSAFTAYALMMNKDEEATLTANYALGEITFQFATAGTWDLINNNEDLELDFENNDADRTYQILRLKEDELWLREKGSDLELHLQPS